MRLLYACAASLAALSSVECSADNQLRVGREHVAQLKNGVQNLVAQTAGAGHGRRLEEFVILDNSIYIEMDAYNSQNSCNSEASSGLAFKSGSATQTYSGCVANEAGTASQKGECNSTHITVEFYSSADCSGAMNSMTVVGVNQLNGVATDCEASSDSGYDLFGRLKCTVGPSNLKGNGNSFTEYERVGEVCSSGCTNPLSYSIFMSGVCAVVTGQPGSAKTTRCKVNNDDTFTLTETLYLDSECSQPLTSAPGPDQDVICSEPTMQNITTADDDFGQNGFVYTTTAVTQVSCNSAAPSQCGSASHLSGASGIVTAILAVSVASLAAFFA